MSNVTIIIPSYNNLRHLKNAYESIRKHSNEYEICIADDASEDGTLDWLKGLKDDNLKYIRVEERLGHTILYDRLIEEVATNDIFVIFHADMIMSKNFIPNMKKHLEKGVVVSGTRIEPPLHPPGKEKIIKDFGQDFDTLDVNSFEQFSEELEKTNKDETTNGIFAPWMMYKSDFLDIGGHDPIFAPFPYEDSDIFNRFVLKGYKLIQSRDAFVYHLTCRGHRWNKEVGKNDDEFQQYELNARLNYIRKWGSWIKNDEFHHPILSPVFNKTLSIMYWDEKSLRENDMLYKFLTKVEPWFNNIEIHSDFNDIIDRYIYEFQQNTKFNLKDKFYSNHTNGFIVQVNINNFGVSDYNSLSEISNIISNIKELGIYELGNITIELENIPIDRSKELIVVNKDKK